MCLKAAKCCERVHEMLPWILSPALDSLSCLVSSKGTTEVWQPNTYYLTVGSLFTSQWMKHKDFAVTAETPCFMGVNFYPPAEGYRTEMPIPNLCSYPAQEVVSLTVPPSSYCFPTSRCCETSYPHSAQTGHIRKKAIAETAHLWVLPVVWRS